MEINTKPCNPANYGGARVQINYIVIHWTSNQGDTAKNNADYFAREALTRPASAHYFVDETETWHSVPEGRIAYHVGAKTYRHPKCRNANSIGVEICMTGRGYVLRPAAIANAAKLVRWLMEKHGVPTQNVIRHHDVTGKDCPAPMVSDLALWDAFKAAMAAQEGDEMKTYKHVPEMPEWAQDTFARLVQAGYVAKDAQGAISVQECSLQPMVYLDRLMGGGIEKLPQLMRILDSQ